MKSIVTREDDARVLGALTIILRGARMRCPRCSGDRLYERWNVLKHDCERCGYEFADREGNCWFFLYSTTAALTGVFLILMFIWKPGDLFLGRTILAGAAFGIIPLTLPVRKGIALALDYLAEVKGSHLLLYDDKNHEDDSR